MDREDFEKTAWAEMVELYTRSPALASKCLILQEQYGVDVLLMLTLYIADRAGLSPTAQDLARLRDVAAEWQHNVVQPLRAVRTWQKPRLENLEETEFRDRIKKAELNAERLELARLCREVRQFKEVDAARNCTALYLESVGVPASEVDALRAAGMAIRPVD